MNKIKDLGEYEEYMLTNISKICRRGSSSP